MTSSTHAGTPDFGSFGENAEYYSLVCGVTYKGGFTVCRGSRHLYNTREMLYRVVSKLQQFASTSIIPQVRPPQQGSEALSYT